MKKKYLVIVFTFICLLLSGCTADYKININEDLSVNEEIAFSYDVDNYQVGEDEGDSISSMLEEIKSDASDSGYEYFDTSTASQVNLLLKRKSNLDAFTSPIVESIYSYFDTDCNDKNCSITSVAMENDVEGDGTYVNYKISIIVPYKVIKQNADEIDLKNNTYIWYYIVGGQQSNIDLVFEKQGKNVIEVNKRNSNIMLVVYIIIGIVVFGFMGSVIYRIIRNSKPKL